MIKQNTLLIHDLTAESANDLWHDNLNKIQVVTAKGKYARCKGCFECWVKTPGKCVISDDIQQVPLMLSKSEKMIIVSKNYYGGLSPEIKRVLDRTIPYISPFFRIVNNEMHHKMRYNKKLDIYVYFYGDNITKEEKQTSKKLITANAINFGADVKVLKFYNDCKDIGDVL